MGRHTVARLGIGLAVCAAGVLGVRGSVDGVGGTAAIAESSGLALRSGLPQAAVEVPRQTVGLDSFGRVVTQTLQLATGWNAVFLEVEPINTSDPVDPDGETGDLPPSPTLSTMEAVFGDLECTGGGSCLDSVWTYYAPQARMDYIVDPSEGLWDEPGWRRFFPATSFGPGNQSRGFLSDLFSLHANTGYLVKVTVPATLEVAGPPVVTRHAWMEDAYNLTGFPIDPDATAPTVGAYRAGSAISEVWRLNHAGTWDRLADIDPLAHQEAYLVRYGAESAIPELLRDYAAPLRLDDVAGDGLAFTPGEAGSVTTIRLDNLAATAVTVTLTLVNSPREGVALHHVESTPAGDVLTDLRDSSVELPIPPGGYELVKLTVPGAEQTGAGEALLAVTSADTAAPGDRGTRWLIPVKAESGSVAGLWVGDVVVNSVSEGRLGATDLTDGALTIALRDWNRSGIQGAAELHEVTGAGGASVQITTTLTLPQPEPVAPMTVISAPMPYVGGYVFVDTNQNGERDAAEAGLAGVTVVLAPQQQAQPTSATVQPTTPPGTATPPPPGGSATSAGDGSYVFPALTAGSYTIHIAPAPPRVTPDPLGHTSTFSVTRLIQDPLGPTATPQPNAMPVAVEVGAVDVDTVGITSVTYDDGTVLTDLPHSDIAGHPTEPLLNFGFVPIHHASVRQSDCPSGLPTPPAAGADLGAVRNGALTAELASAALNPLPVPPDHELLGSPSYAIFIEKDYLETPTGFEKRMVVTCGDIEVAVPTRFADGRGSEFRFRILLDVDELGHTELLPTVAVTDGLRISSTAFGITNAVSASGTFGDLNEPLGLEIAIGADDPLNPFRHKYHPDHDNLDWKFNPIDLDNVDEYLWESYAITRTIRLDLTNSLREVPAFAALADDEADDLAAELDWGGGTWGGRYREVLEGLHKNAITVEGYFIIRHALQAGGGH